MKKNILVILLLTISYSIWSQNNIGVGTNTPDASAKVDITATDKGLLIPRVSLSDVTIGAPITSPANGLMVWNTNASVTGGYGIGFYYWGGSSWTKVATGNALAATLSNGTIWIGNASNVPTEQTISSDVTISNTGVATIQDNSVDGTDIQITANATGDLMMYNGTDWVVLASGTSGYVLTGNGSGVAPSYQDPNTLITKRDVITPSGGAIDFVTSGTSQVVGAANLSVDVKTNTQTQKGIVSAPGASANKDVWGTDASGNPAWRDATNMNNVQNGINLNTSAPNATATDPYIELGGSLVRPTTITTPTTNNLTISNTGTANTIINLTSTGDFDVQDNGTSALFVRDDANVGISTNAPSAKLHVNTTNTATADNLIVSAPSLAANNSNYFKLGRNLANGNIADIIFNYTSDNHADNYLAFGFYGTLLRMTITNDGRVAVKSSNADPSSQFEVDATNRGVLIPRVALTATNAAGPITLPATSLLVYNTATAGASPNNVVPGYYYNSGTTAAPVWKRLATGNGDAWNTIGNSNTTSPAAPVTYGTSTIGAAENFVGSRNGVDLVLGTNNIERMRILSTGNVGIGTATPNAQLQFGNTLANRKIVLWETANNDHQYYGFGINGNTLRYQVDGTSSNHIFYAGTSTSASNELMRIQGNGFVGINTINSTSGSSVPSDRFQVFPTGGKDVILGGGATTGSELKLTYNGTTHFSIYNSGNNKLTFANTSSTFASNTAGSVLMSIDNAGVTTIPNLTNSANRNVYSDASGVLKSDIPTFKLATSLHPSNDDITGWTTPISACTDDAASTITWGFNFKINGTNYTAGWLSTNGILGFGSSPSSSFTNVSLPTSISSDPMCFFHWDDDASNLQRYVVLGTSPNRICYIHQRTSESLSCTGGASQVDVYITLHETSNIMSVRYVGIGSAADVQGAGATYGFQFAGGASAYALPLGFNAKLLDDNFGNQGWSIDFGK